MGFDTQFFRLHCAFKDGDTAHLDKLLRSDEVLTPKTRVFIAEVLAGEHKKKPGVGRDGIYSTILFYAMADLIVGEGYTIDDAVAVVHPMFCSDLDKGEDGIKKQYSRYAKKLGKGWKEQYKGLYEFEKRIRQACEDDAALFRQACEEDAALSELAKCQGHVPP